MAELHVAFEHPLIIGKHGFSMIAVLISIIHH